MGSCRWKPSGSKQSPPQPLLMVQGSTASHSSTALCGQSLFSGILPFPDSLQWTSQDRYWWKAEETINSALLQRSQRFCFPFPMLTAVLPGAQLQGQRSASSFGGCQRGSSRARALCETAGVGGRAGCAGHVCQLSCTTPGRSGYVPTPAQDAFLIKGCPERPVFPLSPRETYATCPPPPGLGRKWKHDLLH